MGSYVMKLTKTRKTWTQIDPILYTGTRRFQFRTWSLTVSGYITDFQMSCRCFNLAGSKPSSFDRLLGTAYWLTGLKTLVHAFFIKGRLIRCQNLLKKWLIKQTGEMEPVFYCNFLKTYSICYWKLHLYQMTYQSKPNNDLKSE